MKGGKKEREERSTVRSKLVREVEEWVGDFPSPRTLPLSAYLFYFSWL